MTRRPPRSTLFPDPPPARSASAALAAAPVAASAAAPAAAPAVPAATAPAPSAPAASTDLATEPGTFVDDEEAEPPRVDTAKRADRKSTRLNSSHANISYAVF